jgi:hypothetical protein
MTRRGIKSYVIGWEPGRDRAAADLRRLPQILKDWPVFLYENGLIVTDWEGIEA